MLLSYKPLHLEAQQRLQEEGCVVDIRHHAGDRTTHKVLQSGFYWPTLFKDAHKFVSSCDECQRLGNIDKRQEMPMSY